MNRMHIVLRNKRRRDTKHLVVEQSRKLGETTLTKIDETTEMDIDEIVETPPQLNWKEMIQASSSKDRMSWADKVEVEAEKETIASIWENFEHLEII